MTDKLGQDPAFATSHTEGDANLITFHLGQTGMSKRLLIAKDAMCAIVSNYKLSCILDARTRKVNNHKIVVEYAYELADELLRQEDL